MKCSTCNEEKPDAIPRVDNGLGCGVHCDECFERMVRECRSRSW